MNRISLFRTRIVIEDKYGFHVTNLNIAQVKQKHGTIERENYNKAESADSKQPGCPEEKVKAIEDAMRHFSDDSIGFWDLRKLGSERSEYYRWTTII